MFLILSELAENFEHDENREKARLILTLLEAVYLAEFEGIDSRDALKKIAIKNAREIGFTAEDLISLESEVAAILDKKDLKFLKLLTTKQNKCTHLFLIIRSVWQKIYRGVFEKMLKFREHAKQI